MRPPPTPVCGRTLAERPRVREDTRVRVRDSATIAPPAEPAVGHSRAGVVILATLAVPFDPEAVRVAAQAALETNSRLIVVDAVERPWWPQSLTMRYAELECAEDRALIKELVAQMVGLGLEVEHLRIPTAKPVDALLDLAGEYQAGLLVLGPDRSRFRPRLFARISRRVRKRATCLLWVTGEGP
jgi:nucleotide-binding universal stress UspA family protein